MRRRRRTRARERGPEDPRQKALDLIAKALDEGTSTEEGRTCAVAAIKHIDEYDLLRKPKRHDTVQAAVNAVDTLTEVVDTIKGSGILNDLRKVGEQIGQARRRR
jgi:hypothetical protein